MPESSSEEAKIAIAAQGMGIKYRRYLKKMTTLKDGIVSLFQGTNFQSFWALRGLELEIKKGERVGIIGPNGSGKSTILKAVAGVLPPTEGTISTQGRIAPLLELGAGFRSNWTGRENVFLNGAILGVSHAEMDERFERIVQFAEIGDFIDAPLTTYSSGMRARLGFSVATEVDAEILLLDEILSVGDENFRQKALARTESFFSDGKTIIMVSHNMSQVKRLCERTIYLRAGEVVADGPTEDVLKQYLADAKSGGR